MSWKVQFAERDAPPGRVKTRSVTKRDRDRSYGGNRSCYFFYFFMYKILLPSYYI